MNRAVFQQFLKSAAMRVDFRGGTDPTDNGTQPALGKLPFRAPAPDASLSPFLAGSRGEPESAAVPVQDQMTATPACQTYLHNLTRGATTKAMTTSSFDSMHAEPSV